jgi:hypothetical protein
MNCWTVPTNAPHDPRNPLGRFDWRRVVGDHRLPDSLSGRLSWLLDPFREATLVGGFDLGLFCCFRVCWFLGFSSERISHLIFHLCTGIGYPGYRCLGANHTYQGSFGPGLSKKAHYELVSLEGIVAPGRRPSTRDNRAAIIIIQAKSNPRKTLCNNPE